MVSSKFYWSLFWFADDQENGWLAAKRRDGSVRMVPRAKFLKEHGHLDCGETIFVTNRVALRKRRPRPPGGGYGWPSSPMRNPPRHMNPDEHGLIVPPPHPPV